MNETEKKKEYDPVEDFDKAFAPAAQGRERLNAESGQSSSTGYELTYLLSPEIAEEKLDLETAELQKIISENGGEAIESETPKKRWLAYPVKKQSQAYFGVIYFNTDKENIDKIKKTIFFNKNVLRFLIISKTMKPKQVALPRRVAAEKTPEMTAPSFEKKLESILNG